MKKYLWGLVLTILFICLDQVTKILSGKYLRNAPGKDIISGVFRLEYLENRGAAFGIFQGQRILLLLVTFLILAVLIYVYHKTPAERKFLPLQLALILIIAGAVGNMIDRIFRNYVIDFLYFNLIDFPIFNIADCYVVVGATLSILLILFYYEERDFDFISISKKKVQEDNDE